MESQITSDSWTRELIGVRYSSLEPPTPLGLATHCFGQVPLHLNGCSYPDIHRLSVHPIQSIRFNPQEPSVDVKLAWVELSE